jgi:F0F1-type ATP synthase delta subunit
MIVTNKHLKALIQKSYNGEQLEENVVRAIADQLNRKMLKSYIRLLKKEEKKRVVLVTTPRPLTEEERAKVAELFPKKRVIENIEPKMISGIKLIENDQEYEMNLNQTFHDIIRFVSKND